MGYNLEGRLLEVCDCNVLCPCWIGEVPDNGTCQSALAYRIDKGAIDGVDVSGLTFAAAAFIPGRTLDGNIRVVRYVDDRATAEQEAALLAAFRGERGGPLARLIRQHGQAGRHRSGATAHDRRRTTPALLARSVPVMVQGLTGLAPDRRPRWIRTVSTISA